MTTRRKKANQELEREFERLAAIWKEDTVGTSLNADLLRHPAYQEIIAMGPVAIPLILRDTSRWFAALTTLTGESPVPPEARGRIKQMREAWLTWGKQRGYLDDT